MNEEQLRAELDAVYASTSWKMTAPFRWLVHFLKRLIRFFISPERVMTKSKKILGTVLRKVSQQPMLRRTCMAIVSQFPRLREKLRKIMLTSALNQSQVEGAKKKKSQSSQSKLDVQIYKHLLTPEAQQILREFQSLSLKK